MLRNQEARLAGFCEQTICFLQTCGRFQRLRQLGRGGEIAKAPQPREDLVIFENAQGLAVHDRLNLTTRNGEHKEQKRSGPLRPLLARCRSYFTTLATPAPGVSRGL